MCQDETLKTVETVDGQNENLEEKSPTFHKWRRQIILWAAACIGLITFVIFLCSIRTFTGKDVEYLFSELKMGMPTSAYGSVSIKKDRQLTLNPMPVGLYVPIYEKPYTLIDLNDKEFTSFVDGMLCSMANSLGTEIPQYTQSEKSRLSQNIEVQMAQYHVKIYQIARQDVFFSAGEPQNAFWLSRGTAKTIALEGEPLQTVYTDDNEENLRYISGIKEQVFRLVGRGFSDVQFFSDYDPENGYATLSVIFHNKKDHPLKKDDVLIWYDTDYVKVEFASEYTAGETEKPITMNCKYIRYAQFRISPSKQYPFAGMARRISVSEAEELLKKGYVFSGTRCCICARNDPEVDFSSYDYVEFDYIDGLSDPKRGENTRVYFPVYKFYKLQEVSDDGTKIYATATVPAVEVVGLAEYAEAYAEKYHHFHER